MAALQTYLSRIYAARQFGSENPAVVVADFQSDAAGDSDLRTAAQTRLTGLTDDVCSRCHCSTVYREFLTSALS